MGLLVAALTYVLRIKIPQTCKKIPFLDQFSMKIYVIWRREKGRWEKYDKEGWERDEEYLLVLTVSHTEHQAPYKHHLL